MTSYAPSSGVPDNRDSVTVPETFYRTSSDSGDSNSPSGSDEIVLRGSASSATAADPSQQGRSPLGRLGQFDFGFGNRRSTSAGDPVATGTEQDLTMGTTQHQALSIGGRSVAHSINAEFTAGSKSRPTPTEPAPEALELATRQQAQSVGTSAPGIRPSSSGQSTVFQLQPLRGTKVDPSAMDQVPRVVPGQPDWRALARQHPIDDPDNYCCTYKCTVS